MKKYIYFILWYALFAYWFLRRPQSFGAGVIVEEGKSILLVRHTYGHRKLWGLPGGHKERHEDYESTASRELFEEVGLTLPLKNLGIIKVNEDYRHSTVGVFLAQFKDQAIRLQKSEISEYRWWPNRELPSNMFKSTKEALKLYLDK